MKRLFWSIFLWPGALALAQVPAASAPPELRPIVPPVPVPMPLWELLLIILGALLVLTALIFGLMKLRRRTPVMRPLLPREIALRDLQALRAQSATLDPYAFSIAVCDILRRYVAAQFGVHAPQQTSPEFLAFISNSPHFKISEQQLLEEFLEKCDLIKFARRDAATDEADTLWQQAEAFVKGSVHESV